MVVPSSHLEKVDLISAVAAGGCTVSVQVAPLVMVSVTGAVYAPEGHLTTRYPKRHRRIGIYSHIGRRDRKVCCYCFRRINNKGQRISRA